MIRRMSTDGGPDPIEEMQRGWASEVSDLDTSAMGTVARLNRLASLLRRDIEAGVGERDATIGDFDVLSALRRQGPPYELKPSSLARATMLSPSGMTHRIDLLEAAGLVERVVDPTSRRTAPVALTKAGIAASEELARTVVDIEEAALTGLTKSERATLDRLLTKATSGLQPSG